MASKQEEANRKKRKDEDYDSDDETEEEWAARDKAEQEAKRQEYMNAAKTGSGFSVSAATTPLATTPAPDSIAGDDDEKENETPMGQGRSLYERITPRDPPATAPGKPSIFSQTPDASKPTSNLFGSKTPMSFGAGSGTSNIFGHLSKPKDSDASSDTSKTIPEKEQGTGDKSWKPNTPIKFGGGVTSGTESTTPAAPPPFGSLFGTQKSGFGSLGHLSVPGAKPTMGFNFGGQPNSLTNSRATTPGVTTDGEGASTAGEGEDDEPPPPSEPQVKEQTGLQPEEIAHEDLLFEVEEARAKKMGEKKGGEGMVNGWVDVGKGPLYILKHKETGKVRVLLKISPLGTTKMNFNPVRNVEYAVQGSSGKMVRAAFVDHFDTKNPKKLSQWIIVANQPEEASEIARLLQENRPE